MLPDRDDLEGTGDRADRAYGLAVGAVIAIIRVHDERNLLPDGQRARMTDVHAVPAPGTYSSIDSWKNQCSIHLCALQCQETSLASPGRYRGAVLQVCDFCLAKQQENLREISNLNMR